VVIGKILIRKGLRLDAWGFGRETKVGRQVRADIGASEKRAVSCWRLAASESQQSVVAGCRESGSQVQQRSCGRGAPTVRGWQRCDGASSYESTRAAKTPVL